MKTQDRMGRGAQPTRPGRWSAAAGIGLVAGLLLGAAAPEGPPGLVNTTHVVLGYNDLGMHCMGYDFSEIVVLPPFNTLHAQVIRRGDSPDIIHENDVTVTYSVPGNTHGSDKTNFWKYPQPLLGAPPPEVGLTGNRLTGLMTPTPARDWEVTGIPIVPIDDTGRENPYPLALIEVRQGSTVVARTRTVLPVSTEMSCNFCHYEGTESTAMNILKRHDELHQTNLQNQTPVLCASCHASNALGLPGQPGLPNLSSAMHSAHADRMGGIPFAETCYACHPGIRTQCQRDVHFQRGLTCTGCHGDMAAVGDPARVPWVDEPRCETCHARPGFEFEQPGTLYRNSVGHKNVHCAACHGSPHAITPTVTATDNVQANLLQGHSGVINDCRVCHINTPSEPFFHRRDDD